MMNEEEEDNLDHNQEEENSQGDNSKEGSSQKENSQEGKSQDESSQEENSDIENTPENLADEDGLEASDPAELNNRIEGDENVISIAGMYKEWFLDYASYVILERAVPHLADGFKPVQRRIMHSMKKLDDGRYNKVANIIGNTMQYHPHGDMSIGDALVQIGQKDLLIDMQGNWGNTLTGDRAAASRYIEARLSKFALDVVFNPKTTEWKSSYDGRNQEPVNLPVKFPLLLAQGAEGIAVGLACKILPHNFIEIIDAAISHLKGKTKKLYPDFPNGAMADFSNYNDGKRGGKIRVRARIKQLDKNTLAITEVPFKSTTSNLIDSILKANDKGKIKIKKVEDNTAAQAEILIHLPPKTSPDKMIDALYAFTDCEISISPNSVIIDRDKPVFLSVTEMLRLSVDQTKGLLKKELEIRKDELENQWHFANLEKIFIEKRIYRDIEEEETWEGVITAIDEGLKKYIKMLKKPVSEEDIVRLTEIKIKRISKFDKDKADKNIERLEAELKDLQVHLDNLVDYAIAYFKKLKEKYGKGRERKTEIKSFENIVATKVVVNNKKLYVNFKEGFLGYGLRQDQFIQECSDIDDIIIIRQDGAMMITKIDAKKFVGKNIIHAAVWKKGDKRTTYNVAYQDGTAGPTYVKRFNVTSITRDKEYPLTRGTKGSRILYFSANPNGQAEIINIKLRPRPKLKKLRFDYAFSELAIKGRGVKGNRLTRNLISKIEFKEAGTSTLAARKIWFDEVVRRLNTDERGVLLGAFKPKDRLLLISNQGHYRLEEPRLSLHFPEEYTIIEKWKFDTPISVIYWDGERERLTAKRFIAEQSPNKVSFVNEHENTKLELVATNKTPVAKLIFDKRSNDRPDEVINLSEFIEPKGISSIGNRLTTYKIKTIELQAFEEEIEIDESELNPDKSETEIELEQGNETGLEKAVDSNKGAGKGETEVNTGDSKTPETKEEKKSLEEKTTEPKAKKGLKTKSKEPKDKNTDTINVDLKTEGTVTLDMSITPKKKKKYKPKEDNKGQLDLF